MDKEKMENKELVEANQENKEETKELIEERTIDKTDKKKKKKQKSDDDLDLGDKIEGVMDDVATFFYGEKGSYTEDIPATMYNSNGRRVVNKVQTRRNFNKRLFGKKGQLIFLIIVGIMFLIGFIVSIIG